MPGFRLGKSGVEKGLDRDLRGLAGSIDYEVDAHGRILRELGVKPSTPGRDVVLTIDRELQTFAQARIDGHRRASVVALDAQNGDVLVMASTPTYDPNAISFNVNAKAWAEIANAPDDPLNARAIRGQYPAGSTFKVVTATAGLAWGVIKPNEKIVCSGGMQFGNHFFHCWKAHGPIALHEAICHSCDTYFYETAKRLGIDKLAVTGRELGLGQAYPCELGGTERRRDARHQMEACHARSALVSRRNHQLRYRAGLCARSPPFSLPWSPRGSLLEGRSCRASPRGSTTPSLVRC